MSQVSALNQFSYRTVWISDVHLGFKGCSADLLLDFLHTVECDTLYLVGDIIDVWNMKKGLYWPQAHNDVIRTLLDLAAKGTKVVYVPGNHDEMFRDFVGLLFGDIEVQQEAEYQARDGKKYLIVHGDQFDSVVTCRPWIAKLGAQAYDWLLEINHYVNWIRRRFGFGYWSLAGYLKHKVKNAVSYINKFEEIVAHEAEKHGADGVVCGHIHHAEIRQIDQVQYLNCGDWVESNTALVENLNGEMEIIRWHEVMQARDDLPEPLAQAS